MDQFMKACEEIHGHLVLNKGEKTVSATTLDTILTGLIKVVEDVKNERLLNHTGIDELELSLVSCLVLVHVVQLFNSTGDAPTDVEYTDLGRLYHALELRCWSGGMPTDDATGLESHLVCAWYALHTMLRWEAPDEAYTARANGVTVTKGDSDVQQQQQHEVSGHHPPCVLRIGGGRLSAVSVSFSVAVVRSCHHWLTNQGLPTRSITASESDLFLNSKQHIHVNKLPNEPLSFCRAACDYWCFVIIRCCYVAVHDINTFGETSRGSNICSTAVSDTAVKGSDGTAAAAGRPSSKSVRHLGFPYWLSVALRVYDLSDSVKAKECGINLVYSLLVFCDVQECIPYTLPLLDSLRANMPFGDDASACYYFYSLAYTRTLAMLLSCEEMMKSAGDLYFSHLGYLLNFHCSYFLGSTLRNCDLASALLRQRPSGVLESLNSQTPYERSTKMGFMLSAIYYYGQISQVVFALLENEDGESHEQSVHLGSLMILSMWKLAPAKVIPLIPDILVRIFCGFPASKIAFSHDRTDIGKIEFFCSLPFAVRKVVELVDSTDSNALTAFLDKDGMKS
eukprot:Lankesteria_metandrocarpae@DN7250_c0_g1_i1.p1